LRPAAKKDKLVHTAAASAIPQFQTNGPAQP
jgi:hypothetical protein